METERHELRWVLAHPWRCSSLTRLWLAAAAIPVCLAFAQTGAQIRTLGNIALTNGQWFNGTSFERKTMYSVDGRFATAKPSRIDRTLDLDGGWIVPPFAEAHNHNIGQGTEEMQIEAIRKYLADGVFYVLIQGNLPMTEDQQRRVILNRPESVDAIFVNGQITGSGGHPAGLAKHLLIPRGFVPGHTEESLPDLRYFEVDSEVELENKWSRILSYRPDIIKVILLHSDQYDERRNDPAYFGNRGLNPNLLPIVVGKAHAANLRVAAHVNDAADFHVAVSAGANMISHFPSLSLRPGDECAEIDVLDAKLAAQRRVTVVTTTALLLRGPRTPAHEALRAGCRRAQIAGLELLHREGVVIAIGSDDVNDSSLREFEYVRGLGIFDNLTLLRMWTEATSQAIFPDRKIGALEEGYEASFLALEGNPLDDLAHVRRIKLRFKQGLLLAQILRVPAVEGHGLGLACRVRVDRCNALALARSWRA